MSVFRLDDKASLEYGEIWSGRGEAAESVQRISDIEPPFPKRVRVGYRWYRVIAWSPEEADDMNKWGQHSPKYASIRVEKGRPSETANTLLHEIIHGAMDMAGFDHVQGPSEEFITSAVANLLTQVFQDNADLRDWMAWAWAQES